MKMKTRDVDKQTHVVSGSPDRVVASLDGAQRLPVALYIPHLDGGIVTASGKQTLILVAPVQVVDLVHVS